LLPRGIVAVVTHAEIIRSLLLHWHNIPVDDFAGIDVPPASATTVEFSPESVRIHHPDEAALA
jgi:broad specificity phosphatase PhoE